MLRRFPRQFSSGSIESHSNCNRIQYSRNGESNDTSIGFFRPYKEGKKRQQIKMAMLTFIQLYLYLQSQMPLEQLPNLSGDFPRTCILARHPHLSEFSLFTRQKIEENALRTELSALTEKVSEVSKIITQPDYFWRLAQTNSPLLVQPFDQLIDEGLHRRLTKRK